MSDPGTKPIAAFGPFVLDVPGGNLLRGGESIHLQPLAFRLLTHFLRHPGRLFSRLELQDLLWPDTFVGDEALTQMIRRVRKAIEAPGAKPEWLITVPRRGYRFSEAVRWSWSRPLDPEPTESSAAMVREPPIPKLSPSLPMAFGPFFGRERSLKALSDLFETGVPIITILGPGGLGKTRLAIHFASSTSPDSPLAFVDLSSIRDLDGLVMAVGNALGVPSNDESTAGGIERIGRVLGSGGLRGLILDNYETVIDYGRDPLSAWLEMAPEARFMVTSRERLDLAAEHVLHLKPMRPEDAKALFRQRAEAAGAYLGEEPKDEAALEALIEQLDRSPLAIELAAGRAVTMGIEQIIKRLDQRFKILKSQRRDLPRRHQSLQTVIEDSLSRLDPDSVRLLKVCARLPGPVSLDTLESLSEGELENPKAWIPDIIQTLTDRSLLWVRPQVGVPPVFGMQENIRAYLRIHQGPTSKGWAQRLKQSILSRLEPLLMNANPSLELVTLIEAGLSLEEAPKQWMGEFAIRTYSWFRERGMWARWNTLMTQLLQHEDEITPSLLVSLLIERSEMSPEQSQLRVDCLNKAEAIAKNNNLKVLLAEVNLHRLAQVVGYGQFQRCLDELPTAEITQTLPIYLQIYAETIYLVAAQSLGHFSGPSAARGDNPYAHWRTSQGTLAQPKKMVLPAEGNHRIPGILLAQSQAKHAEACAYVLSAQGEMAEATTHHARALTLYRRLRWRRAEGALLGNIAVHTMGSLDTLPRAKEAMTKGLSIFEGIGETIGVIKAHDYLSFIAFLEGAVSEGKAHIERGLTLANAVGYVSERIALLKNAVLLQWLNGDHQRALHRCQEAIAAATSAKSKGRLLELKVYQSCILSDIGAVEKGEALLAESTELLGDSIPLIYEQLLESGRFHLDCAMAKAAGDPPLGIPPLSTRSGSYFELFIHRTMELAPHRL